MRSKDSGLLSVSSVSNSPTTGAIMAPFPKCMKDIYGSCGTCTDIQEIN